MGSQFTKKGRLAKETLVVLLLLGVSLIIIIGSMGTLYAKIGGVVDEITCRATVAGRGHYDGLSTHAQFVAPKNPLLCRTSATSLPVSKEDPSVPNWHIKKDIADLAARCWWQFGEGLVKDPFKRSRFSDEQCFQCYQFVIDPKKLARGKSINADEMRKFMFETAYEPNYYGDACYDGAGQCVHSEGDCDQGWEVKRTTKCGDNGKYCCYKRSACENRNGQCIAQGNLCPQGKKRVDKFSCTGRDVCCMDERDVDTYGRYIQFRNGKGALVIQDDLQIKADETYGVAFMGAHKKCVDWCTLKAIGGAVGGGVAGFAIGGPIGFIAGAGAAGYKVLDYASDNPSTQYVILGTQQNLNKVCPSLVQKS